MHRKSGRLPEKLDEQKIYYPILRSLFEEYMARENILSDFAIKALKKKPAEKLRRHLDGKGLFFVVSPTGV